MFQSPGARGGLHRRFMGAVAPGGWAGPFIQGQNPAALTGGYRAGSLLNLKGRFRVDYNGTLYLSTGANTGTGGAAPETGNANSMWAISSGSSLAISVWNGGSTFNVLGMGTNTVVMPYNVTMGWTQNTANTIGSDTYFSRDSSNQNSTGAGLCALSSNSDSIGATLRIYGLGGANGRQAATSYNRGSFSVSPSTGGLTIATEAQGAGTAGPVTITANANSFVFQTDGTLTTTNAFALKNGSNIVGQWQTVGAVAACVMNQNGLITWQTGTGALSGTNDVALMRTATGVIEINNSTAGSFRDLKLRNLIPGATLATTMTDGFMNIPGAAGPPTGVPNVTTGVPLYFDNTNLKLYAYTGGAWKSSAVFT